MPFRPLRPVTGRGHELRPEPASTWDEAPGEAVPAPPAPAAVPEQLSLFVFDDTVPARPPRLRRLKSLLAALESQRHGLDELAVEDARREAAAGPSAAHAPTPTPLWPDSFFD